jgi:hypothetical protein
MSRRSRKELAVARGDRRPVLKVDDVAGTYHRCLLDCGHVVGCRSNTAPKHVRCPRGCVAPNEDRVGEFWMSSKWPQEER